MTKKEINRFNKEREWMTNMLYADAVRAKHLGYKSMHYKFTDDGETYYVDGELFEKFATGVQDDETKMYAFKASLGLYEAQYGYRLFNA